jgi:hypothetical protein
VAYYQTGLQKPLKDALSEVSFSLTLDHRLNKILVETYEFSQKLENRYAGIYTMPEKSEAGAKKSLWASTVKPLKERFDRSSMAFILSFIIPSNNNKVEEGLTKRQSSVFQMFRNARLYYTGIERDIPQEVCAPMQKFLCDRIHPKFLKNYSSHINGISYVNDPFVREALEGYRAYQSKQRHTQKHYKPG